MSPEREALFLDRDGTLIEDVGYPRDPGEVRLLHGAAAGLARLRAAGFAPVVISNQSGVGRGLISAEQLEAVHERMTALLALEGAALEGAYYCPHAPWDRCSCRKPGTELIDRARIELDLGGSPGFLVGDRETDIEAGLAAGCRTIMLTAERPPTRSTWVAADWEEIERILMEATG